ncbi:MAG: Gfo/Idh/MocA family oxidoreductase [Victivallaceae bacterium]
MIKIGCVNIDTSHPGTLAAVMRDNNCDMYYHGVYNNGFRTDDEVGRFMKNNNVKIRYVSLEEMARDIDIAFIHDCNWDKHIAHAMPFLEAGKPVFIDKPPAGNLNDCFRLEELEKGGAAILGSSSVRYAVELETLKRTITENHERIASIFAAAGVDEFNYGVHLMEGVHGLLGMGVYSTTYLGVSRNGNNPAEQYLVKWNNGVQVIYQVQLNVWQPFNFIVTTDKNIYYVRIDSKMLYPALIKRIEAFMKENKPMAPVNALTETIKIYLAGKRSRESKGQEITLESLSVEERGFDGYAFEKKYAFS